jgi:hypothetical protein
MRRDTWFAAGLLALLAGGCDGGGGPTGPDPVRLGVAARLEALAAAIPRGAETGPILGYGIDDLKLAAELVRVGAPSTRLWLDGTPGEEWEVTGVLLSASGQTHLFVAWRDTTDVLVVFTQYVERGEAGFGTIPATAEALLVRGTSAWRATAGGAALAFREEGRRCRAWRSEDDYCAHVEFEGGFAITAAEPWAPWPGNTAGGSVSLSLPSTTLSGVYLGMPYANPE